MGVDLNNPELIARCEALPPRVKNVLRGFANYRRPKEIANDLQISVHTVREYEKLARERLGVGTTRAAVLLLLNCEAQGRTPNKWGDQNEGVALDASESAASDGGPLEQPFGTNDEGKRGTGHNAGSATDPKEAGSMASPQVDHIQNDHPTPIYPGLDRVRPQAERASVHASMGRHGWAQWILLILVLILAVIAVFGIGTVGLLGVFQVLKQVGGPRP